MGAMTRAAAEQAAASPTIPWWLTVLGLVLGSGALTAVVTSVTTSRRAVAEVRRQGYADAIEAVLAWSEYAYRIRRRTSDDAKTMGELATLGHELQERRVRTLAWVAGESSAMYEVFLLNVKRLNAAIGPLVAEAWTKPPVSQAHDMVLSGWGPGKAGQETVERLSCAVSYHSGWRRRLLRPVPFLYRSRLNRFLPPDLPVTTAAVPDREIASGSGKSALPPQR
jgi:hypothetical protein